MCDFLTLHPYYIYPRFPQMQRRSFREKNPRLVFYNTHTHLLERELPILCEKSLQPLLLPSPIVIPSEEICNKHNPHLSRVQKVFWSLGSFGELPKETGKAWQMQSGVLRDSESQTGHGSKKFCWSRSLEGFCAGRLGLKGLLLTHVSQLIVQWIDYRLEGGGKVLR